jgi:(p)ppGpp synthase/HD superfamily hydrolase
MNQPQRSNPKELGFECEKAIILLTKAMSNGQTWDKPTLFHSIRVGSKLYEMGYPRDIVLAGFLHDLLEDTPVGSDQIESQFGKRVLEIVKANSKDPSIKDSHEKRKDMVVRCAATGSDALIVKIADVVDNFKYFTALNDPAGLDYGHDIGNLIFENLPNAFSDPLLDELKTFLN